MSHKSFLLPLGQIDDDPCLYIEGNSVISSNFDGEQNQHDFSVVFPTNCISSEVAHRIFSHLLDAMNFEKQAVLICFNFNFCFSFLTGYNSQLSRSLLKHTHKTPLRTFGTKTLNHQTQSPTTGETHVYSSLNTPTSYFRTELLYDQQMKSTPDVNKEAALDFAVLELLKRFSITAASPEHLKLYIFSFSDDKAIDVLTGTDCRVFKGDINVPSGTAAFFGGKWIIGLTHRVIRSIDSFSDSMHDLSRQIKMKEVEHGHHIVIRIEPSRMKVFGEDGVDLTFNPIKFNSSLRDEEEQKLRQRQHAQMLDEQAKARKRLVQLDIILFRDDIDHQPPVRPVSRIHSNLHETLAAIREQRFSSINHRSIVASLINSLDDSNLATSSFLGMSIKRAKSQAEQATAVQRLMAVEWLGERSDSQEFVRD